MTPPSRGLTPESLTFTVTEPDTYLIVESYRYPGTFSITTECDLPPEDCDNDGVDDDLNGKADCQDPACYDAPNCQIPDEVCDNDLDDDGDGDTDCDDADCQTAPECENQITTELACGDGIDNDNDGVTDCADPDCADRTACGGTDPGDGGGDSSGCSSSPVAPSSSLWFLLLFSLILLRRRG